MRRIVLGLCIATITGCATQAEKGDQIFNAILSSPPVAQSIFREGDVLSFEMLSAEGMPKGVWRVAQIEAECSGQQAKLVYLDGVKRLYLGGQGNYTKPKAIPAANVAALAKNPDFIAACVATPRPDWRVIKATDPNNWVLIDRNSLQTQGSETLVWAAYDSPSVLLDMPYNAPYAQKREHYGFDCSAKTYRLLAGYDVDAGNQVTDGNVELKAVPAPIASSNEDYRLIFAAACGAAEKLAALPVFVPRVKAPLQVKLAPVERGVLASIEQLQMPKPLRSLSHVVIAGTTTYKNSPTKAFKMELSISEDAASGQLRILEQSDYEDTKVSWRGLFSLASQTTYGSGATASQVLTALAFTGDWQRMPINARLNYTRSDKEVMSIVGAMPSHPLSTDCTVMRALPAGELNKDLAGDAKELSCSTEGDEYKRVNHLFYLVDYGYFFSAGTDKNPFYYDDLHIESAH